MYAKNLVYGRFIIPRRLTVHVYCVHWKTVGNYTRVSTILNNLVLLIREKRDASLLRFWLQLRLNLAKVSADLLEKYEEI